MVKRKGGGKKQVLHLSQFLGDAAPVTPVAPPVWSDDCPTDLSIPAKSTYDGPSIDRVDISSLPSAPRAQREGSFDPSKVPRNPPFTAYVGNLPFDTEDDDVDKMFARNTVKEVRLLKDKETGHFKGFGYVEFETAEGLIEALKMNEKMIRGRPIKIDVATTAGNREGSTDRWDRDRNNNDGERGERQPYVDTTSDDWRRDVKPQDDSAPAPYERRGPRRYDDDGDSPRGRRNDDEPDTFSRSDFGTKQNEAAKESTYKPRFRNDEHDDRGDRGDSGADRGAWGRGGDRGGDSDKGADRGAWGRGGGDRDSGDRPERGAWGRGGDDRGGDRDRDRSGDREDREEKPWVRHGEDGTDSPSERPRLNLKPRTAPITEAPKSDKPCDKPSPFGRAKPVDVKEKTEDIREGPEGGEIKAAPERKEAPKSNPFGAARPADTAAWRSSRMQGTGPIKTPTAQKVPTLTKDEVSDELISDSNKFMVLDEEESM